MKNKNHQNRADYIFRQAGRERYQSRPDMAERAWRAAQEPRGGIQRLRPALWKVAAVLILLLMNGFVALNYSQGGSALSTAEVLAADYNLRSADVSDYLTNTSQ